MNLVPKKNKKNKKAEAIQEISKINHLNYKSDKFGEILFQLINNKITQVKIICKYYH